jgi:hypothetical protein
MKPYANVQSHERLSNGWDTRITNKNQSILGSLHPRGLLRDNIDHYPNNNNYCYYWIVIGDSTAEIQQDQPLHTTDNTNIQTGLIVSTMVSVLN